tara:strand:+ start:359 stop:787 length:429 start_codon:yes stop_codon:yes gene_type:complete
MIKTFKGLLADDTKQTIRLGTINGLIGYRIVKLQLIHNEPGEQNGEHTMKVFTVDPPDINNTINFDDPTLIAVAHLEDNSDPAYALSQIVVMDHVKFNQDIYITHTDSNGTRSCNYYLELEQMKLTLDEATVATLKDMRGRE